METAVPTMGFDAIPIRGRAGCRRKLSTRSPWPHELQGGRGGSAAGIEKGCYLAREGQTGCRRKLSLWPHELRSRAGGSEIEGTIRRDCIAQGSSAALQHPPASEPLHSTRAGRGGECWQHSVPALGRWVLPRVAHSREVESHHLHLLIVLLLRHGERTLPQVHPHHLHGKSM